MNSMQCIIVDDEAAARSKLARMLAKDGRVTVLAQAENGFEAVEQIQQHNPELVFLDIQMPSLSGFDVIRLLPEDRSPHIVFVTAYDEYALQAFDVSAVDYLLKPYGAERLAQAIEKVFELTQKEARKSSKNVLDALPASEYATQLALHSNRRIKLINVEDIAYINSEHRLINVYDQQGDRFWTNETLAQLTARLDPDVFFRIHRSSVINLKSKFEIEPWEDGRLRVHFPTDVQLTVARDPARELRAKLGF